jgi:hypothetical protein
MSAVVMPPALLMLFLPPSISLLPAMLRGYWSL